ncbi:DUF417 family protein [Thalassomonas actiniarum]|uniref:DUF417 family protein n=2 Tax=Thalassomonas actiniarum TaxID=485447 RepID=A0AAE9YWR4_9GAMM|nr:DUF417 family protein [Thalassomonas actiniarum]
MGPHKHITLATDFYSASELLPASVFNAMAALAFIASAILALLSIQTPSLKPLLGYLLVTISLVPLVSLFAETRWIASMGGFPVIGSGQGVIKYFALLSIAILFIKPQLPHKQAIWLNIAPVMLVLLWIGGMKFTAIEAKGIEDLVLSSPLMSWMYQLWDVQTTSNLIGVYDLVAVVLLIAAIYYHKLVLPAIVMSGMVFVVTQTFLISFDASISADTLLTSTGHFLIKDLWFIANLILFYLLLKQQSPEKKTA